MLFVHFKIKKSTKKIISGSNMNVKILKKQAKTIQYLINHYLYVKFHMFNLEI